jgi:hypothetical protein
MGVTRSPVRLAYRRKAAAQPYDARAAMRKLGRVKQLDSESEQEPGKPKEVYHGSHKRTSPVSIQASQEDDESRGRLPQD